MGSGDAAVALKRALVVGVGKEDVLAARRVGQHKLVAARRLHAFEVVAGAWCT